MDPILSQILLWGLTWAPQDWAMCNGQTMNIQQNTALFSLLGVNFGGNGTTTFMLPDFRGRTPIGCNNSLATRAMYNIGAMGGAESVQLTAGNIPPHTHTASATTSPISVTISASPVAGTDTIPGTNGSTTLAASSAGRTAGSFIYNNQTPTVALNGSTASATGGAVSVTVNPSVNPSVTAIDNRQPYLAVNFIIALSGIYPTRP